MTIESLVKQHLSWLHPSRLMIRPTQFALDLLVLVGAFALSYMLRFDFDIPDSDLRGGLIQLPLVVSIQFAALVLMGVYSFIWRYIAISEVKTFMYAVLVSCLPILTLRFGLHETLKLWRVPISIIILDTILVFGGVLSLRVVRRMIYEWSESRKKSAHAVNRVKKPVLLIGAGRAGMLAAKEIQGRGDINLKIKGFVDDDPKKKGSVLNGIKVLGNTDDLPQIVRETNIDHVVISIAQASRRDFKRILDICKRIPVKVRIIPGLYEILQGNVSVSRIRDLQIEDLLGREPVNLDDETTKQFLSGKVVMVTGAGGSIGSELARQVARLGPSKILLVERNEFVLFAIDRELRAKYPDVTCIPLIADVSDEERMSAIFNLHHPQVVLHSAAHKHVPLMEKNPAEAVKNNVLGTYLLGRIAGKFGVEAFVLMSSDKAVRPTSIMGATKRVAELVTQDLDRRYATRFVAVRCGNVIGSAGSVIPIFKEQIRNGGPVTITHPDMKRYFMTIPEAVQLVLQAGALGKGGEIFILDMGEPVRILDLAKEAISLSGLRPFEDIEIAFTGTRPGEKLFEELAITEESISKTRHPKIFIGKIAAYSEEKVSQALNQLALLSTDGRERELRKYLSELLPEATLETNDDEDLNAENETGYESQTPFRVAMING